MDKHNDGASTRYAKLEERLAEFIARFDQIACEMDEIKAQQAELLNLLKNRK